ncbi:FecR family protein [Dyadobacter sp. CY323]|uniref:FecR family protein n=1 Tax=Dyadobacter sp. CY323 TaxID=2907302 RepID=UPI001F293137|nr:FecR family protein [Dyadobacter sp. CY323]MCE6988551.1 FecR domain-containing protein [Dyadobacter sp. CY323]
MSYDNYDTADFLEDPKFRAWVYDNSPEVETFWLKFLIDYPEKSDMINSARSVLLVLFKHEEQGFPEEYQVDTMWENIVHAKERRPFLFKSVWLRLSVLTTSAAIFILVATWLLKAPAPNTAATYRALVQSDKREMAEKENRTEMPIRVTLPDGSRITLKPRSSVSYPKEFDARKEREVYLSGEAFFDVKRNPDRPFFVYANELVTRVLGTSFSVKAYDDSHQLEVEVKTGKVSVFTRKSHSKESEDCSSEAEQTILTPNQKVLYSRSEERMKKMLVDFPEVIASSDPAVIPIPHFQDAPVSKIFANLEAAYGIDIVYDENLMGNCLLTASFSDESLYDKIDLICKGVEAEFKVMDSKILISGRGCH